MNANANTNEGKTLRSGFVMTTSECVVYRMSQHILFTVVFSHVFMLLMAIVAWRLRRKKILTWTEWLILFLREKNSISSKSNEKIAISEFIENHQPFLVNRYIWAWNMDNFSLNKFNWVAIIRNTKKMSSYIFVRWMYRDHTTPFHTNYQSIQFKEQIKSKLITERGRYNLWGKCPIICKIMAHFTSISSKEMWSIIKNILPFIGHYIEHGGLSEATQKAEKARFDLCFDFETSFFFIPNKKYGFCKRKGVKKTDWVEYTKKKEKRRW